MGTLGDLLGEAIWEGIKYVGKNIQENIQEEQLKSAKEIYIICSPPSYTTGNALRAAALEQLFIAVASFMDIELITENKDVFFKVFVEEEDIGGGKKIHLLLNFILYNGNNLVIQGVRGMGTAGITIVGNNSYELAKKIINALQKLEFEDICVVKELIDYHDADEINEACEELLENFEAYHNDNEGDEDEESEDEDEDEESEEYEDDDEIDEDDNIVELCQFFSLEYPDFEATALKKSYRKMMTQYHPDKVASLADDFKKLADQKTKEINEKYECLLAWVEEREKP